MSKGKILFSGNTAWSMYNFRRQVISHFIKEGYDVVVAAPNDNVHNKKLEEIGAKFINIELDRKGTNPIGELKLFFRFRKIIKSEKPDYCFFYTIKPNIYGGLAAGLTKTNFTPITTGLGFVFNNKGMVSKISKSLYKAAFSFADNVWFLNDQDKKDFVESKIIKEEKGFVLKAGEGLDINRFHLTEITGDKRSFLLSARMLYEKGVGIFEEAARILKPQYPNVEFNLLGFIDKGNPEGIPEETINQWVKEGNVNYLGKTDDVRPFIEQSTCVVLPSYYREGVPFSILEGAACGRPIITTDNTGCREVVNDGVSGYLCKKKDAQSLAKAMEKIINSDNETLNKMGKAGREKVENEFNVNDVIEIYKQEINKHLK